MSDRQRNGWAVYVALLPVFIVSLTTFGRHHAGLAGLWPIWRPMFLDLALVVAAGTLVAAVIAGVVAWRRGAHA